MWDRIKKYSSKFSEVKFWSLLKGSAKRMGAKVVYSSLLLYYAYRRKETPSWAKRIVLGTLGYLVTPIDAIPDLSPFIGFTDDIGVLSFGVVAIASFINDGVKKQAREHLTKWFGEYDEADIAEIDAKL